jgi:CTP:molybdopterin cytidylyltransferase MocA
VTCDYDQSVPISAIVLAAGLSSRMGGEPKALLPFDDRDTFVTRIVRTFNDAGIGDVVVVLGHEAPRVATSVEQSGLAARCVVNPDYRRGQFSSLIAGLEAVDRPEVDAVLLALVDAPMFASSTVTAIVQAFERTSAPVVRAVRGDQHGHPVLLARSLFDPLRRSDPTVGAKPVVRAHASAAGDVPVDDPGAFVDVDTPADYAAMREALRTRTSGQRTGPAAR